MPIDYDLPAPSPGLYRDVSGRTIGLEGDDRSGDRTIEITDLQTTVVKGNFPWVLVRVYTDAGVVGTGEAYWGAGVEAVVQDLRQHLVGENPLDIDRLYELLIRRMSSEGSLAGTTVTAISGVEIALHDLVGKVHGLPAYQLLGGKYRSHVRVYCDTHAGAHATTVKDDGDGREADDEDSEVYSPEAYAAAAEAVVAEGYDALKFDLDATSGAEKDRVNRHLRHAEIDEKVTIVETVLEAVPDDVDVAFDCHWIWSGDGALRLATALEPYDIWWLEDPVPPETPDVLRRVTQRTTTTIASGENRYRKHGAFPLVAEGGVDVVHPDMPKVGGMRETRKIADIAELFHAPVAIHNVCSPLGTAACAHVAAACPNFIGLEFHSRDLPWWGELVNEDLLAEGFVRVPEGPGLGVTLDRDVLRDHLAEGAALFD
jgi:gluconate/galactonate dehydratase